MIDQLLREDLHHLDYDQHGEANMSNYERSKMNTLMNKNQNNYNQYEQENGYRQADNAFEGQLIGGEDDPENFFANQDYEGNIFGLGDEYSNGYNGNRIGNINQFPGPMGFG